MTKEEIDVEYLITLIDQIHCKNNGITSHLTKKSFQITGMMVGEHHLSFDYLREKSTTIDMLLRTIIKDILLNTKAMDSHKSNVVDLCKKLGVKPNA